MVDRFPFVKWLHRYSLEMACSDFIAGLTVGLMVVPQSIAYAQIAHVEHQVHYRFSRLGSL
jgi:sodium-independent sulfate anion transporter 11